MVFGKNALIETRIIRKFVFNFQGFLIPATVSGQCEVTEIFITERLLFYAVAIVEKGLSSSVGTLCL